MLGYLENQVDKKDIKSVPKSTLTLVRMKMSKNEIVRDVKGFKTSLKKQEKVFDYMVGGGYFPQEEKTEGEG